MDNQKLAESLGTLLEQLGEQRRDIDHLRFKNQQLTELLADILLYLNGNFTDQELDHYVSNLNSKEIL